MNNVNITLWKNKDKVFLTPYLQECSVPKPAVIVCPGGGYMMTADNEADPVARAFQKSCYHAFVLRYSNLQTGESAYPQPLFDIARAMEVIHENAEKWMIDTQKIVVCGFSAGGHLASSLGTSWKSSLLKEKFGKSPEIFRPAALILSYPLVDYTRSISDWIETGPGGKEINLSHLCNKGIFGKKEPSEEEMRNLSPINHIDEDVPPCFIWHTTEDPLVEVEGSLEFAKRLKEHAIPFEIHLFEKGPHALSLCTKETTAEENLGLPCSQWFGLALRWLEDKL